MRESAVKSLRGTINVVLRESSSPTTASLSVWLDDHKHSLKNLDGLCKTSLGKQADDGKEWKVKHCVLKIFK